MSKGVYESVRNLLQHIKRQNELLRLFRLYVAVLEMEIKRLKEKI